MSKGTLYVLSAPSGCGKGTVIKQVRNLLPELYYSVSVTTRGPRPGEVDGVDYSFISKDEFNALVKNDGMLEYAIFVENSYGTPKAPIMERIESGKDVILEIETAGAMMVKAVYPEAVLIFMLPPSIDELRRRLIKRGTESMEVIDKRVAQAIREIKHTPNYDYIFINDKLDEAVADLIEIMKSAKHLSKLNNDTIKGVLQKC